MGLFLSFIVLYFLKSVDKKTAMCLVVATSFLTNYFYYILSPKSDYMLLHLTKKDQIKEWLRVYKTMQYVNHLGFALGIVGVFFLANAFCK